MEPVIEVKHIGKKYNISHMQGGYVALRDVLMNVLSSPFSFLKGKARSVAGLEKQEEFWALRDVNFSVQKGEIVGVIGANGAGKSTLLKILSRITPPTEGEIVIRGTLGSLLEVGTGFHPELTGRENIFLNGAILGMTRHEITRKFDQIVEFSGIEKFIDTPVKRYSSGMYVRLAFSVAAHMEPDILLVDEVLAVGDAEFQRKSLGKMQELTRGDKRTILFVSHNLSAIEQLCRKCILLEHGKVKMFGDTRTVIDAYLTKSEAARAVYEMTGRGSPTASMKKVTILGHEGKPGARLPIDKPFSIELEYEVNEPLRGVAISISFFRNGELLLLSDDFDRTGELRDFEPGTYTTTISVPAFLFNVGEYSFEVSIHKPRFSSYDHRQNFFFEITDANNPRSVLYGGESPGKIATILEFKTTHAK